MSIAAVELHSVVKRIRGGLAQLLDAMTRKKRQYFPQCDDTPRINRDYALAQLLSYGGGGL